MNKWQVFTYHIVFHKPLSILFFKEKAQVDLIYT